MDSTKAVTVEGTAFTNRLGLLEKWRGLECSRAARRRNASDRGGALEFLSPEVRTMGAVDCGCRGKLVFWHFLAVFSQFFRII